MKKDLTELVFILDMSGSMAHLTDDTIGGFNSVLKEHNDGKGEVLVTTYVFNNESKMVHDRLPIANVPAMTEKDFPQGAAQPFWMRLAERLSISLASTAMHVKKTSPSTLFSLSLLTEWRMPLTSSVPSM